MCVLVTSIRLFGYHHRYLFAVQSSSIGCRQAEVLGSEDGLIYIYIYIERERERDRERDIYTYIYIYREREGYCAVQLPPSRSSKPERPNGWREGRPPAPVFSSPTIYPSKVFDSPYIYIYIYICIYIYIYTCNKNHNVYMCVYIYIYTY